MNDPRATVLFISGLGGFLDQFVSPIARRLRGDGLRTVGAAGSRARLDGFDRIYQLQPYRRGSTAEILRAARQMAAILRCERPSVVHLHTPPGVALGRLAATLIGVPSIAVIHTTFLEPRSWRSLIYAAVEGSMAGLSVATVAMNEDDATFYRRVTLGRSVLIAPVGGIGLDYQRLQTATQRPWSFGGSGPNLTVVGRLTPEKNLDLVVAAFSIFRRTHANASLWFVGSPHQGDREWVVPTHISGVHHIPWVADVFPIMAGSDVLVSASRREGFGLVVAEALALGIPVASVASRGVRHIRRFSNDLLQLANPSAVSLAAAMQRALTLRQQPAEVDAILAERWSHRGAVDFHSKLIHQVLRYPKITGSQ